MKNTMLTISAGLGALLLLGAVAPASAEPKHYKDLTFPKLNDVQMPDVQRFTLANGMKLYLVEDRELPLISASARIKVGSVYEPGDKIGLAELTGEVMRTGGTATRTGDEIDELLEGIGASVETSIGTTNGSAGMSVLRDDVDTGLAILADVLMNPEFRQEKIDLAKVTARSGISRRNDDPMGIAIREYMKLIYGAESPYARHEEYATIDAITREDMLAFHETYYHPNNVMLAVWGDFDAADMKKRVEKAFAGWKQQEIAFPELPAVNYEFKPTVNQIAKDDATQSTIVMGHIGITMDNPDYFPLLVMNDILGSGGFASRLFQNVRSRLGLAYAVGGQLTAGWEYPGPLYVFCMTKSETTVKAIRAMMDEVRRMTEESVTDEELQLAKDAYLNSFVFNFDTKSEVVNRIMTYDYYGFPEDFLQKTKAGIESTTKEDVLRVAKKYLHPDALQITVVGKPADFDEPLAALGAVNEIDVTIPEPGAEAVPEASAADLEKGQEVLAKTMKALGGADTAAKVKNSVTKSNVKVTTPQGPMDITATATTVYPDRMAAVLVLPFGEITQVMAGDKGWMKSPMGSQDMPTAEMKDMKASFFREQMNLMRLAAEKKLTVQHLGEETVGTVKCEVLNLSDDAGNSVKMYVDAKTGLPVKQSYRGNTQAGPAAMEESYDMWKAVDGIQFPFKTVTTADGKEYITSRVTSITLNAEVDEGLFKK